MEKKVEVGSKAPADIAGLEANVFLMKVHEDMRVNHGSELLVSVRIRRDDDGCFPYWIGQCL